MADTNLTTLFSNKKLLEEALTHRSWVNEHKGERRSNERLEFLGDAVLELIISRVIYDRFPDKEEGYMTALRANLVNTTHLAKVAKKIDLGEIIYLSKGEEAGGGRQNTSLLADCVEAVIGALYLDRGIEACEKFIEANFLGDLEEKVKSSLKDAKSTLQELVQTKGFRAPHYKVIKATGPDHAKTFDIAVLINGEVVAQGTGTSKNLAAQDAASRALLRLKSK
jgi:ribonuclease III